VADPSNTRKRSPLRVALLLGVLVIVAGLGAAAVLVLNTTSSEGDSLLERWVRGQIIAIVNDNLHPQLEFATFDLQLPDTVALTDIELVSTDTDLPGGRVTIFQAKALRITLAKRPRRGEPLKIERLELTDPALRLVASEPGGTSFAGFSNLVKQQGEAKDDGGSTKLSDIFQLRLIKLNNGMVVYDPRLNDTQPMTLDGINTQLELEDPEGGWHDLALTLEQAPIFNLDAAGRLHIDDGRLDINNMNLQLALSRESDDRLPPQVQQYLTDHDVRGQLDVTGAGQLVFADLAGSTLSLDVSLQDGHATFGEYVIPIRSLTMPIELKDNKLTANLNVQALGGQSTLDLAMQTTGSMPGDAKLAIADMRIENLLAAEKQGGPPKYAGKVDANVHLHGPFSTIATDAAGQGTMNLVEGRLVNMPIISGLIQATTSVVTLGQADGTTDTADATFTFEGDRAAFSDINVKSAALAARGKGDIYLDSRLALRFNGGPVESVQGMLGRAGEILGAVTDQLMNYTVKGTLAEPKVGVQVISALGDNAPDKKPKPDSKPNNNALEKVGEQLEDLNPFK